MKRVVFLEDIAESAIRPDSLYRKYQDILSDEVPKFFSDHSQLIHVDCPGCDAKKSEKIFVKFGLQYCKCTECNTVFASPRPSVKMLNDFYQHSEAVIFWKNEVALRTKESRHRHQSFPLAHWVLESADEYLPSTSALLDYNSKYPDFLNIISEGNKFNDIISINPEFSKQMDLYPQGLVTLNALESIKKEVQVITAFEVLDRIFDPKKFIQQVYKACGSDSLFFLTANTYSGFEYQMLNEMSPRLHPPDRLNLLTVEAIQNRLTESGFEIIELSTPGRVDVEIVRDVLRRNPSVNVPEIFRYIFRITL